MNRWDRNIEFPLAKGAAVNIVSKVPGWCGRSSGIVADTQPSSTDGFAAPLPPRLLYDRHLVTRLLLLLAALPPLYAQTGAQVLLVGNSKDAVSRQIVEYYRSRRSVPAANICWLSTSSNEEIEWVLYQHDIEGPVGDCLKKGNLREKILYIVTTLGVPLKIDGTATAMMSSRSSVDSELTLLYSKLRGEKFQRAGTVTNPYFGARNEPLSHPRFPIYLVTRLAGYDFADVKGMIDHSLAAKNRGMFVIDAPNATGGGGN